MGLISLRSLGSNPAPATAVVRVHPNGYSEKPRPHRTGAFLRPLNPHPRESPPCGHPRLTRPRLAVPGQDPSCLDMRDPATPCRAWPGPAQVPGDLNTGVCHSPCCCGPGRAAPCHASPSQAKPCVDAWASNPVWLPAAQPFCFQALRCLATQSPDAPRSAVPSPVLRCPARPNHAARRCPGLEPGWLPVTRLAHCLTKPKDAAPHRAMPCGAQPIPATRSLAVPSQVRPRHVYCPSLASSRSRRSLISSRSASVRSFASTSVPISCSWSASFFSARRLKSICAAII